MVANAGTDEDAAARRPDHGRVSRFPTAMAPDGPGPPSAVRAFDVAYEGTPTWETGVPQGCVVRMVAAGLVEGAVVDVGCGTGLNALHVAASGHEVVGIDGARAAIEKASERTRSLAPRGGSVSFVAGDAFELGRLGRTFDTALDIGLFHCLQPAERPQYAASLATVVRPGGVLRLVAWSDRNPLGYGPERISRRAIHGTFQGVWRVESIVDEVLDSRLPYGTVHAWRAVVRRRTDGRGPELGSREGRRRRA